MKKMKDAMKDVLVLLISVAMIFTMGNPLSFAFSDDEKKSTTGMPNLQTKQTPIVNPEVIWVQSAHEMAEAVFARAPQSL